MTISIFVGLINVLLRAGSKTFDEITATATKIPGSKPPQREKSGGFAAALRDYLSLMGKEIKDEDEGGKIVKVKDMQERGRAVVRNISSDDPPVPTLELQKPGGSSKIKAIRYRN